jgi:superfamily II DNA or RNA helicase
MINDPSTVECDDGTRFPPPRDFQIKAHKLLRQGFKEGHKNQIICSPTGSGKSYLGLRICNEAIQRGKRAVFLCDRTTLIDQTSQTADRYGMLHHGVIQANHWRRRPQELFQIASIQTISKRGFWPELDVLVVDESHSKYKAWVDFALESNAAVIGLSATPFTVGLGKIFTNVINAATMNELTQNGVLVPMRIFSCHKPDMTGAKTIGGEWSDKAAEERELKIVGDVVSDWKKYAENRKTIVFGATIAHCEELCRKFIESGVMAAVFTSDTSYKDREILLKEYKKQNSHLKVLISVEALAKGFDCVLEGSKVLTNRGPVNIEKITLHDKIWDGYEFVSHDGIIFKGERNVITYEGLTATEDHLVKTAKGWVSFGECKKLGIPIVKTGNGWKTIREDDNNFSRNNGKKNFSWIFDESKLQVQSMWKRVVNFVGNIDSWCKMQSLLGQQYRTCLDTGTYKEHDDQMPKQKTQSVFKLWRSWNSIQVQFSKRCGELDSKEFGYSQTRSKYTTGSNKQRWPLRTGEFTLGQQIIKLCKYTSGWLVGKDAQIQNGSQRNKICRQNIEELFFNGYEFGSNNREVLQEVGQAKGRVWDILNCGPRNSFTCEGLLVHNCSDVGCVCDARPLRKSLSTAIQMWGRGLRSSPETGKSDCYLLDFSGNIVRFFEDFTDFYFNGLSKLDDGEKLDKKIRDKEEFEPKGCPKCGFKPFAKRCMSCGHEKVVKQITEAVPGHMREIFIGTGSNKKKLADNAEHLWNQVCSYARIHSKPENQSGRAWHLFKQITGQETKWAFSKSPDVEITSNVINKIKQMNIQFNRRKL